jgi:alginate O-acetyltransferase complex protein AlgI
MLFNSIEFLIFFPIVTGLYFLLPHRFRWFLLLAASCFFYMFFVPVYILILAFTIVIDYIAGILIENAKGKRRKWWLVISIISNVGVLAIFKYYNFLNGNITHLFGLIGLHNHLPYLNILLPIGLSFHTFQAMSYTIEVYRGNQKAERHFGIYSLYVMFYPQLVAGPIERPQNLLYQFREKHEFDYQRVVEGLRQMLWGMFKKVVIADRLSVYVGEVFDHPGQYHGLPVIVAAYFFAIQIYCDFSGYSDIAIGSAKVMGFKLMQNFNLPYFALSVREFWSRWHISLSTWFRDYLYIPLGGNRVSQKRWLLNLMIVFIISGLWHGAKWTFVIWGALHGFYLVVEILLHKLALFKKIMAASWFKIAAWFTTFHLVVLGWIFFRAVDVHAALVLIRNMARIDLSGLHLLTAHAGSSVYLSYHGLLTSISLILLMILVNFIERKRTVAEAVQRLAMPFRWTVYYLFIVMIVYFGNYSGKMDFIYFQF